jgi:hypothetical protein
MFEIKVDTGCSYSMSGTESDFLKETIVPVSTNTTVSAYGGAKVQITGKGTLKWVILDDLGRPIDLIIPNSLYIKGTSTRLLSPQHYAQEYMRVHERKESEVLTVVHSNRIEMHWSARKLKKTIQLEQILVRFIRHQILKSTAHFVPKSMAMKKTDFKINAAMNAQLTPQMREIPTIHLQR